MAAIVVRIVALTERIMSLVEPSPSAENISPYTLSMPEWSNSSACNRGARAAKAVGPSQVSPPEANCMFQRPSSPDLVPSMRMRDRDGTASVPIDMSAKAYLSRDSQKGSRVMSASRSGAI